MAAPATTSTSSAPFLKGSIIWEKRGPLPVWAWALIVLGLVLAITMWRRNRAAADPTPQEVGTDYPDNLDNRPIFVVPQGANPIVNVDVPITNELPATVPNAPPGGGRPNPPAKAPKQPAPKSPGKFIPVAKWTAKNPPFNSTLSGIWSHFSKTGPSGKTTAANWQAIWNHPLNADLRRKRGQPEKIQAGDQIFVPGIH